MKYISIDIETTGLDPELNDVLSIGAIIEDSANTLPYEECPKFHAAIVRHQITGSPRAINMNAELIEAIGGWLEPKDEYSRNEIEMSTGLTFYYVENVVLAFHRFLFENGLTDSSEVTSKMKPVSITVAGKNFASFDKLFLEKLPRWKQAVRIKQRILDPAILYVDWKTDSDVPNLLKCKERAGINGTVTHNALEDAWDVIEVLRKKY
jgi:DNA polymerase III epsilon subunit-like protein